MVIRIKPKAILKILVDSLMTLALLLLMGFQFWGDAAHEWIGMGMFILFFAHHILNWNWYKNLFRGRYSAVRICGAIIDVLLVMTMIALVYSNVVMSRYVFGFLDYNESKLLFYLDYLALMGLGIFVFHYLGAALRKRGNTKK